MTTTTTATTTATVGATGPRALLASARAEGLRLRKWPAMWVTVGAWLLMNAFFAYIFNYITYRTGDTGFGNEGTTKADLLHALLPASVPDTLPQGMPLFGGAIMMVLGAIAAGNGFGWGTWKTVFTQGPSRRTTVLGSMAALTGVIAGVVLATLATDFVWSLGVAGLEGQHVVWPGLGDTAQSAGIAFLVMEMWALAGYLLGTLARSAAVSVGLGLVWALVIENLLRGVGASLGWVDTFTHFLPGTASGSLVGRFVGLDGPAGTTPGLFDTLSSERALITVACYIVVLPLVTLWLMRRRDVS